MLRAEALEVVNAADSGLSRALNAQDRIARLLAQLSTVPGQEQARAELDAAVAKLKADVTAGRDGACRAAEARPAVRHAGPREDHRSGERGLPRRLRRPAGRDAVDLGAHVAGGEPRRLGPAADGGERSRRTLSRHFIDGTEFDSNAAPAEPAVFGLDKLIPGWTEGVPQMRVGETFEFVIPTALPMGSPGGGRSRRARH